MGATDLAQIKDRISFAFKADVIHGVLKRNEQKLVRSVTFPFRYIADPIELEINAITDTVKSTLTYISKLTVKTVTKLLVDLIFQSSGSYHDFLDIG
jgi:hypothetical protein